MMEMLDTFTKGGKFLGEKSRQECHQKGVKFYHKVIWLWLYNTKGQILIQKRAPKTDSRAGRWGEISVAGHVVAGEQVEDACFREVKEELGANVQITNLTRIHKHAFEHSMEIATYYIAQINSTSKQMVLQKEEVSKAKFVSIKRYLKLLNGNKFGKYPEKYIQAVTDLMQKIQSNLNIK